MREEYEPYVGPLGRLSLGYAELDERLVHLIGVLLGVDDSKAERVCAQLGVSQRLDLATALFEDLDLDVAEEDRTAFANDMAAADSAIGERNKLIHGTWWADPFDDAGLQPLKVRRRSIKNRKGFRVTHHDVSPQHVEKVAGELFEAAAALLGHAVRLGLALRGEIAE
jgi:hypothetical protein